MTLAEPARPLVKQGSVECVPNRDRPIDRMTTSTLTDYFPCGHAASSSWRAAAEAALAQCGAGVRGATLGFVYTTDAFADDYADILEFLRRRTGIAHWVGTIGLGVCASGREYL